jgi:aspartate 1-decarboxylase
MSIAAENIAPAFHTRRSINAADLKRLQDPAVIFEGERADSDGERFYTYTVAGWLDGQNIASMQGGATVGGDVIVIHAQTVTAPT